MGVVGGGYSWVGLEGPQPAAIAAPSYSDTAPQTHPCLRGGYASASECTIVRTFVLCVQALVNSSPKST